MAGLCPLARQISHSDPLREMDEQPLFEGKCILEDNQNFKSIKNGVRKALTGYIRFFWSLSILVCQELFSGIVGFQNCCLATFIKRYLKNKKPQSHFSSECISWMRGVDQFLFLKEMKKNVRQPSKLNCALRDDEAVYWVSNGHYEAMAVVN